MLLDRLTLHVQMVAKRSTKEEAIYNYIQRKRGKKALDARNGLDKVFETGIFNDIENGWSKSVVKKANFPCRKNAA